MAVMMGTHLIDHCAYVWVLVQQDLADDVLVGQVLIP
jgi:hypothetical protein